MSSTLGIVVNVVTVLLSIWYIWRSFRTGILAGNPELDVTREEKPIRFWAFVALFVAVAVALSLRTAGYKLGL